MKKLLIPLVLMLFFHSEGRAQCGLDTPNINGGPDQTFCLNLNETATINVVATNGQQPITYQWDHNQASDSRITVRPTIPTTYTVTATDANNCSSVDSILITPIQCNDCFAAAGEPLPHKEVCMDRGRATITTEDNIGINIPQGYEKVYILSDHDLTIVDYVINRGSFTVTQSGVYRVHTLIAEVNRRNDEDYFDIGLITRRVSNLFLVANCVVDHGICADFDFPGRVHVILPADDRMCMTFENTINLCGDGIDNDSDGLVDCNDPDCRTLVPCLENTLIACNDLYDNDGDGLVDCFDSDCWEFLRCYEREEDCKDGIDNDGDGLIDCADDSCFGSSECMEDNPYTCKDGLDNDRDGLIDCAEASCQAFLVCAEWGAAACTDGLDNDSDGLVDCADADCRISFPTTCGAIEASFAFCGDGIDNDADGLVDCADPDCGVSMLDLATIRTATTSINATCPNNNGSISIVLNQLGWEYSINGGASFGTATTYEGLTPGNYNIALRRASGCSVSGPTITVTGEQCPEICENGIDDDGDGAIDCADPDCGLMEALPAIVTDPVCPQVDNGSIRLFFLSGGNTAGIEYSIDGALWQNEPIFRNLIGGTYNVQLRTTNGCTANKTYILSSPDCPEVCNNGLDDDGDGAVDCADPDCGISLTSNTINTSTLSCPSKDDGSITVTLSQSGLQYSLNDGAFQNEAVFENLVTGSYLITVVNGSGCQDTLRVLVADVICTEICDNDIDDDGNGLTDCEDPACNGGLDLSIEKQDATCPQNNNGSISITGDLIGITLQLNDEAIPTSTTIDDLLPGTYTLSANNINGCMTESSFEIQEETCVENCSNGIDDDDNGLVDCEDGACTGGLNALATSIPATCPNNNNATIRVENPQGSLEYSLNGETFQEEGLFENLGPGNYVLMIRNALGCSDIQTVVVAGGDCTEICDNGIDDDGNGLTDCEDPACSQGLDLSITKVDASCPRNDNGSITVDGDLSGLSFLLNDAVIPTNSTVDNLVPGTYVLNISNENGCETESTIEVTGGTCVEDCDNGIDDDNNGLIDCEDGACNMGLDGIATSTAATCPNNNNGTIQIATQEGIEFSLNGETFQTEGLFGALTPGNYVMTTRNAQNCTSVQSIVVDGENCTEICDNGIDDDGNGLVDCEDGACQLGLEAQLDTSAATCPNNNNGSISILAATEGSQFSIDGENFQTENVFENLLPGDYTLTVQNSEGCINTMAATITESTCSEICDNGIDDDGNGLVDCEDNDCSTGLEAALETTNATCPDNNNGTIQVLNAAEGTQFSIDGQTFQASSVFSELLPGDYSITVQNTQGCNTTIDATISESTCTEVCDNGIDDDGNGLVDCEDNACNSGLEATLETTNATCPDNNNGTIQVLNAAEGMQFSIDGQIFQADSVFSELLLGDYTITIQNTQGCTNTIEATISESTCSEICDNGIDDDGNGLVDCEDDKCAQNDTLDYRIDKIACPSQLYNLEILNAPEGSMIKLNNGDFQSSSIFENLESMQSISATIRNSQGCDEEFIIEIGSREPCVEICNNGIDDDGNGMMDCEDSFCEEVFDIQIREANCPDLGSVSIELLRQLLVDDLLSEGIGLGVQVILDNSRTIVTDTTYPDLFFDSLSVGIHTIKVIGNTGCEFEDTFFIVGEACGEICNNGIDDDGDGLIDCSDRECNIEPYIDVVDVFCPDGNNGSITLRNPQPDQTYIFNGGPVQSTAVFENLAAGTYSLEIIRANGCRLLADNIIVEAPNCDGTEICNNGIDDDGDGLIDCEDGTCNTFSDIIVAVNQPSCLEESDGIILVIDGLEGYQYSLSGSAFQLSTNFNALSIGDYLLTIRNAEGCDTTITTTLATDVACTAMSEGIIAALQLNIKVFLEGPYDPNTAKMNTLLNDQGYLPGQLPITYFGTPTAPGHPYNQAPWHYEGSEGSEMIDNIDRLQSAYAPSIVDWVLVSLRTGLSPETEIFQGTGLLHEDGTVEMQRLMEFTNNGEEYYIVIEHRNHLPIMSPTPIPVVQGEVKYDFTARDSYRSIIGTGQLDIDGTFMMVAGNGEMSIDYSSDTDINVKDLTAWLFLNGENSSYYPEDYDLNGDINIKDRILWEKNNGSFSPIKTK